MLDKKEALLEILRELFWVFDLAEQLYEYIETQDIWDDVIDNLINLFYEEIKNISNEGKIKIFEAVVHKLEILKEKELKEREEDFKSAEEDINNFIF